MGQKPLPPEQKTNPAGLPGKNEELLSNHWLIRSGEAVNQVLVNCAKQLGPEESPGMENILNLFSNDPLFILAKLWQISLLKHTLEFELICLACKGPQNFQRPEMKELLPNFFQEQQGLDLNLAALQKAIVFGYPNNGNGNGQQTTSPKTSSLPSPTVAEVIPRYLEHVKLHQAGNTYKGKNTKGQKHHLLPLLISSLR